MLLNAMAKTEKKTRKKTKKNIKIVIGENIC